MPELSVLVTGAGGFIATHVIQQLQQAGHRVRGTIRDVHDEDKVGPLWELCPNAKHTLELIEADLNISKDWKPAATGCNYVIHIASPYPNEDPEDENDVIGPAVTGTLNVLRGCHAAKGVRRVILTSCTAAITTGATSGQFSEADWTDVKKTELAYYKSKTLAEKAAWEFVNSLPVYNRFELVVLNPCNVVGPVLCGGWATSMEITKTLLERDMAFIPKINLPIIDVRDVATAHVNALTIQEAAGHRHILASKNIWWKEIAEIYEEEFDKMGYYVPTTGAPYVVFKVMSLCNKSLEMVLPLWGKVINLNNSRMLSVLGILPRSPKESYIDMAHSMIKRGLIKKTVEYVEPKVSSPTQAPDRLNFTY